MDYDDFLLEQAPQDWGQPEGVGQAQEVLS